MRILLFTGKGGVGKTTVAAATAAQAAEFGMRTIVCSTDPAHSLADAFDVPLGDRPTPIAQGLFGQQLNARVRFEEAWDDVRTYLVDVLDWAGADAVEAEELAVIPGLDEVFALGDIKEFATNGEYDLVVVDCAPTAETIRLLSLPDVLGWYMDRMFDTQRRLTRLARPILQRVSGVPIAGDGVFGAIRRFYERLDGVRELLTDGDITSARLVVNPERLVVAEARRTFTYLSLFGYHVDAVIANRILPAELDHPWMTQWRATQSAHLDVIAETFAP
ncbi:MAG: arsenite/tail-anchored protein-transporting ATPase [Actinomycetota bacterium]|jgi:arsenite-transporting ATPase|nr:arsenite/tail-anchored protein-transporting ATPase [Actinomycetota bacterium]